MVALIYICSWSNVFEVIEKVAKLASGLQLGNTTLLVPRWQPGILSMTGALSHSSSTYSGPYF